MVGIGLEEEHKDGVKITQDNTLSNPHVNPPQSIKE